LRARLFKLFSVVLKLLPLLGQAVLFHGQFSQPLPVFLLELCAPLALGSVRLALRLVQLAAQLL
jgi:hypothetical protein